MKSVLKQGTHLSITLAQYWILALLHFIDFKHWVATPIYTYIRAKKGKDIDCTHLYVSKTKK